MSFRIGVKAGIAMLAPAPASCSFETTDGQRQDKEMVDASFSPSATSPHDCAMETAAVDAVTMSSVSSEASAKEARDTVANCASVTYSSAPPIRALLDWKEGPASTVWVALFPPRYRQPPWFCAWLSANTVLEKDSRAFCVATAPPLPRGSQGTPALLLWKTKL